MAAQRDFVLWWALQEKNKGGGDVRNTGNRPVAGEFEKLETYQLDKMTVSRWRQRLKESDKFEKYKWTHARKLNIARWHLTWDQNKALTQDEINPTVLDTI